MLHFQLETVKSSQNCQCAWQGNMEVSFTVFKTGTGSSTAQILRFHVIKFYSKQLILHSPSFNRFFISAIVTVVPSFTDVTTLHNFGNIAGR